MELPRSNNNITDGIYQVTTPYLCAGFIVKNGIVTECAPILRKKFKYWITMAEKTGTFFQTMSLIRYNHLSDTLEASLNDGERSLGWHFCPEYDGGLINKQDPAFRNHKCNCKEWKPPEDDGDICI